jgi:replicative DNA helicase
MLSDLRESGSIEQDADQVLLIHRKEGEDAVQNDEVAESELIVAKNRNGPTGDVSMLFRKRFTRFELRQNIPTNWASPMQA